MTKSFHEAYSDSTDVLRDINDRHDWFLSDAADIVRDSKVTDALRLVTHTGDGYRAAAKMHLDFANNTHGSIGGVYDIGPAREQTSGQTYTGAKETYDHLNHYLHAIGALAQSHSWSIGAEHPLTKHIVDNYTTQKKLINKYAKAWGFADRFKFDDIMRSNQIDPDQFE